jgi:hypothetical protein
MSDVENVDVVTFRWYIRIRVELVDLIYFLFQRSAVILE